MVEPVAWSNEYYHQDDNFELLRGEKRSGGRLRETRHYAAALARSGDEAAQSIAAKLRSCAALHRCGEGICPQCMSAEKRGFLETVDAGFGNMPLSSITIIPTEDQFCRLDAPTVDIKAHAAFLEEIWAAAGLMPIPIIAGFDISREVFSGCVVGNMWCGHWHGLVPAEDETVIESRLSHFLPKTMLVKVPLRLQEITKTPAKAYSYRFKTRFDLHNRHIESAKHRRSAREEIVPEHPVFPELARVLADVGLCSRIIHLGGEP